MSYKDILVYLDPSADTDNRVALAVSLARAHDARLIGLDVSSEAAFLGPMGDRAVQVQPLFDEALRRSGATGLYASADPSNAGGGHQFSHSVDLIIAPRPDGDVRDLILPAIPEAILVSAGVPMLILPQGWKPGPVGQNIMIAWNASREATRAVHDALPLLAKASKVTIFSFAPRQNSQRSESAELADHLARHGVKAKISDWVNTRDITAIDALFASLDTQEADLIVAGAFGHSRLFETLFGGVSADLMRQPSLPVFLSH